MIGGANRASDWVAGAPVPDANVPNINSTTGLSTDYLNHFTEAIMVLEMVTTMPECLADLQAWRPKTYCEHFADSRFSGRDAAIAAYHAADPNIRKSIDSASETLNTVLAATRDVVVRNLATPSTADILAQRAVAWLKPLIARTAAVINGTATGTAADRRSTQVAIDALFKP
jgi:hypothetical protein